MVVVPFEVYKYSTVFPDCNLLSNAQSHTVIVLSDFTTAVTVSLLVESGVVESDESDERKTTLGRNARVSSGSHPGDSGALSCPLNKSNTFRPLATIIRPTFGPLSLTLSLFLFAL